MDKQRRPAWDAPLAPLAASPFWLDVDDVTAGSWLFREGEPVREITWVREGIVRLVRIDSDGRATPVGLRGPGSLVGGVTAMQNDRHRLCAHTIGWTRLSRLDAARFRQILGAPGELALRVRAALERELRATLDDTD